MSQPVSGFDDKVDVGATLVEPKDYGGDLTAGIDTVEGLLGGIDDVWQWAFGWSLLEAVVVPLSGNWDDLQSFSDGWATLAEAAGGVSTNLSGITSELRDSWRGEAGNAFGGYMNQWGVSLAAEKAMCEDMSAAIGDLSDNTYAVLDIILSTAELIVDIVTFVLKAKKLFDALRESAEVLEKGKKLVKVVEKFADVVESFTLYCEALKNGINEANDNQPMPNGEVGSPEEPGASTKKGDSTKGEGNPAPEGD